MSFLRLRNVSVDFPVYHGASRSLRQVLLASSTRGNIARNALDRISVRALDDVTLDIGDGDRIGLIGANGAGKTTLLKVLAGIYAPTRGSVQSAGRKASLLNSTLGFDPDATGRDNIILRGVYVDVHPREMRKKIDDIVAFSELGAFIDLPVRTYSAGMLARLAFAVATSIDPEILLMDEWLFAGDAWSLEKARRRVEGFVGTSHIMVLASHSFPLLQEWCNRGVLLDSGRVAATGTMADVIATYQARMTERGQITS